VGKAKKTKAKTHLDFLTRLFTAEMEERDRKRGNLYIHAAKPDILKTFEDCTLEGIKSPQALSTDDLMCANYVPKPKISFFTAPSAADSVAERQMRPARS
jgi:hypothetical protein